MSGVPWQAIQRLTEAQASAIGLPHGLVISNRAGQSSGTVLVPIQDAIERLEQARTVATTMDDEPLVFVCTNAYEARSLTTVEDPRDRRYLSGVRTIDGFHVYCGSIEAAISRGLAYAPYADVVCYQASRFDLAQAQCFASAVRASFPDKPLGVGFPLQHGFDHACYKKRLIQLGYRYFFLNISESLIFPAFPEDRPWVLFDDGAEFSDSASLGEVRRFRPLSLSPDLRSSSRHRGLHRSRP